MSSQSRSAEHRSKYSQSVRTKVLPLSLYICLLRSFVNVVVNCCKAVLPLLAVFEAAKAQAKTNPEKIAIIDVARGTDFTYTQLFHDVSEVRLRLFKLLEVKDDLDERRIAFLVPAGYDYVVILWAIWAAGGIAVPLCMKTLTQTMVLTHSDYLFNC